MITNLFDIIVVGWGHAGIEAAVSAARMSCSVALLTMDKNAIGRMSCNPAIGGTAKGHLVREIDALGGLMGKIADETGIQPHEKSGTSYRGAPEISHRSKFSAK